MSTISERLQIIRGPRSRRSFAEFLNIPASTLKNYEDGDTSPTIETLELVCEKMHINRQWLAFGVGPMKQGENDDQKQNTVPVDEDMVPAEAEMVLIPLVEAQLSAGHGSFETDSGSECNYAFRYDFLFKKGSIKDMVLMRVRGDSMSPAIENGDMVLIDQSQNQPLPGCIYAVGVEDMVYLKRIDATPGKLTLYSDNSAYAPLEILTREQCEDSVRIIGRAVWYAREV